MAFMKFLMVKAGAAFLRLGFWFMGAFDRCPDLNWRSRILERLGWDCLSVGEWLQTAGGQPPWRS
jgi:hypothetical protein